MAVDPTDTNLYPLGSDNLFVLQRNASDVDKVMNGDDDTVTNRFGDELVSVKGIATLTATLESAKDDALVEISADVTEVDDAKDEALIDIADIVATAQDAVDISTAAAAASEEAAAQSEVNAEISAQAAAASGNWQGDWEDGGAGTVGESYSYLNVFTYRLKVDLADILTSEPSPSNEDWQLISVVDAEIDADPTIYIDFTTNKAVINGGFGVDKVETTAIAAVTHARSTDATGVAGNLSIGTAGVDVPRIVYDGDTGECLGYQAEESRTNHLLQSGDLSDETAWTGNSEVVYGTDLSVSGLTLSEVIPSTTLTATHAVRQTVTGLNSELDVSASIYVRRNSNYRYIRALIREDNNDYRVTQIFDLDGESLGVSQEVGGATLSLAKIEQVSDSVLRLELSATLVNDDRTNTQVLWYITTEDTTSLPDYSGDGVNGVHMGGAQLEVGSFPTSYIPTTTSTVTRGVDRLTVDADTVLNYSSFSVYFDGIIESETGFMDIFSLTGASSDLPRLSVTKLANNSRVYFSFLDSSGQQLISYTQEDFESGQNFSSVISFDAGLLKFYVNGVLEKEELLTDTSEIASLSFLQLFRSVRASQTCKKLRLYNKAISDSEAIRLTL